MSVVEEKLPAVSVSAFRKLVMVSDSVVLIVCSIGSICNVDSSHKKKSLDKKSLTIKILILSVSSV